MLSKPEALASFPHIIDLDVVWNDMDAMQHVNNTVYFRYLETARLEFIRDSFAVSADFFGPTSSKTLALAEASCRFKVSLTYPDTIQIGSKVSEIGEQHCIISSFIYSKKLGFVAAEGIGRMVYYDYSNKCKANIEGEFLERLQSLRAVDA